MASVKRLVSEKWPLLLAKVRKLIAHGASSFRLLFGQRQKLPLH